MGIAFVCCKVFEIVKVRSSIYPVSRTFFPVCFYLIQDICVADIHNAWLVYICMYCVPVATLNQNKWSRLLYWGDMQIIIDVLACGLVFSHLICFFSCNTITFQKYFWCSRFSRPHFKHRHVKCAWAILNASV